MNNLSAAGKRGGSAPRHNWTDEEREIVRRDYRHTHACRREIASKLGVTENAVAGQIARMGIGKRSDRRYWIDREDEILIRDATRYSPRQIARRLHRSINSVVVRMKRLKLSRRVRDGWYTKRDACEILGVDHKRVQRWIDNGMLKAHYHNGSKPQQNGSACWHIWESDLARFIRHYPQDLNGRNVDLIQVVDILVGLPLPPTRL